MGPRSLAARAFGAGAAGRSEKDNSTCRAKSQAAATISPLDAYFEEDPTVKEWLLEHRPTAAGAARYFKSFFPFVEWIGRYNLRWLTGDVIGGITLGFVVVPQAMAYAMLAGLRPEFGLYTSFTGAALYWLFGTSKDIAIGATAVISLLIGRIVAKVQAEMPGLPAEEASKTVSLLAGFALLGFGLLRLDWLIELIPHVAIAAFVTSAAITISLSQLPAVLGITGVNTRDAPYKVFIATCKALPRTTVDAAVGLSALFLLQLIKSFCARMGERQKHRSKLWATISSIRMTFVILLYTLVSFIVNRGLSASEARFRILGSVPTGFSAAGVPSMDTNLIKLVAPELPALLIVLIIEHIAIGKSFGRVNNYTIVPSQEIISISAANILGPFLGGYAATGSFTGTAVLSKAGVRTPLAGVFNGLILLLALYALTSVFFFIPLAALSGLIIHAVLNLITRPPTIVKYWKIAPMDVFIFFTGVFLSLFESLEFGIYATVGISLIVILLRIARSQGQFLGRLRAQGYPEAPTANPGAGHYGSLLDINHHRRFHRPADGIPRSGEVQSREAFLPLDRKDGSNPAVDVSEAYAGVFIYRFTEGFNYINQAQYLDHLVTHVTTHTRRTDADGYKHAGDRPWNMPAPKSDDLAEEESERLPRLHAVVLDLSAVNQVDTTAVEALEDVRAQLNRWAAPGVVEWHLAGVRSRWTRRALAAVGFGLLHGQGPKTTASGSWMPVFDVAATTASATTGLRKLQFSAVSSNVTLFGAETPGADIADTREHLDLESGEEEIKTVPAKESGAAIREEHHDILRDRVPPKTALAPIFGVDRPFFHVDLASAVSSAVENARRRDSS
ncbi:hypothetical protein RB594_005525 [Gaeumannomyces avenae]